MKTSLQSMTITRLGVSIALAFAGCSHDTTSERATKQSRLIQVATVSTKDVPIQIRGTGRVAPFASVAMKSEVDGELQQALFNEGDELQRGQTMLIINSSTAESAAREAQATLQRDQALAASAEAEAHQAEALQKEGIGPTELVERARAAVEAFQATIAADKVALENAQLQLLRCRIASPVRGRVGKLLLDPGNTVRRDRTVLAVVNQTRPSYVDFLVPEEQLPAIQEEMKSGDLSVKAAIPGNPGKRSTGKLLFIDNTADPETAMVSLRARFDNDDEALWPGETVDVTLTLRTLTNAVVVPASAVQAGASGPYVIIVKPDLRAERRAVRVGEQIDGETIVTVGLRAGERLITHGQEQATPGKRIRIPEKQEHNLASAP